jgi:hypothetical protein
VILACITQNITHKVLFHSFFLPFSFPPSSPFPAHCSLHHNNSHSFSSVYTPRKKSPRPIIKPTVSVFSMPSGRGTMGLFSKALRRRRHRASPEVDLLSAAFGLPFRRGAMPADQKTFRRSQVIYETESDDSCESYSEETSSSSSEDDSGHQERGRCVSDRPPTPHSAPPASTSSSKKNSPRKRYHRRRRSKSSPHSSPRVLPRHQVPRSISRRSNVETMANQQPVSYVRPSATFPPQFPIHLSKPPCNIVQSSTFPISPLNQSFGDPV